VLILGGCYHSITIDMVSHVKLLRHDYRHDFPEPVSSCKVPMNHIHRINQQMLAQIQVRDPKHAVASSVRPDFQQLEEDAAFHRADVGAD